MNLDKIQIPSKLLSELYGTVLVQPIETPVKSKPSGLPLPAFWGKNKKNISIILPGADSSNLSKENMQFLNDIFKACILNLDDLAIAGLEQLGSGDYRIWNKQLNSNKIFLFGPVPETIGLPRYFPHFQTQSHDGILFLSAPALALIREDKALKSKLWLSLKKIFGI